MTGDKMTIQKIAKKICTPARVQDFLRSFSYNREKKGETLRSAREALKKKTAHCLEATFIAAAILEVHGYPPLVVSFSSQDGLDHVIYVFRHRKKWGSVARSRDEGLHGRQPIFRSLRDLVWSYYDPYIDGSGKIIGYQIANLDDTETDWRNSKKFVWKAEKYLIDLKHKPLRSSLTRYKRVLAAYKKNGPMKPKSFWW
ncbi:MAG: hypothetical protein AB7H97_12575 [Pseudobdellovibrionaceae bacterium]